jgi:antitoxin component HigA of HigAB toxin-antitoxin module
MEIRPIHTDKDHKAALAEIEASWGAPEGSEQGDKLEVLLALVEIYEASGGPSLPRDALIRSTYSTMPSTSSGTPRQNWPSS